MLTFDLCSQVVSIIESRARGLDLLTHNYYELLYAFHIARHNYRKGQSPPHTRTHARTSVSFIHVLCVCVRSAGTVMFEFGMRLGREVRTRLGLQKQVNCYLAALNCLRLIRPEYAWIVQPVSGATVHTHTHRLNLCDLSNSVVILFFVGVFPAVRASRCVSEEKL